MAVSLTFADSFAHYDNTALKWSTGGGVFETNPAHVRTGLQSLRVTLGNAPKITNFDYPVNSSAATIFQPTRYVVGMGWQTSNLNGDTIFELWALRDIDGSTPLGTPLRQFF